MSLVFITGSANEEWLAIIKSEPTVRAEAIAIAFNLNGADEFSLKLLSACLTLVLPADFLPLQFANSDTT